MEDSEKQMPWALTLDKNHYIVGSGFYNGTRQRKFLKFRIEIPVELKVLPDYFLGPKADNLIESLHGIADNLVSLSVIINPKQGHLLNFENAQLPQLQWFSIEFNQDDPDVTFRLAPVSKACPNLKRLRLPCGDRVFTNVVLPYDFATITLPSTLTILDLSTKLESKHLRVLVQSSLPNLKGLTLLVHRDPFENGLVFQVLENVRLSLEHFFVQGEGHDGSPEPPTYFRFPVMEKLSTLHLESQHFELESEDHSLGESLPKLSWLRLMLQTQTMLDKWLTSKFGTKTVLSKLYVTKTDDNFADNYQEYHLNLEAEDMRRIHLTFPHVTILQIDFRRDDNVDCLVVVFSQMTLLEGLEIFVNSKKLLVEEKWTSALLAVPLELVTDLKKRKIQLGPNHPTAEYSIRNLKKLNILKITSKWLPIGDQLISDLVFEEAFFQMAELTRLIFTDQIVSEKSKMYWEERKRIIEIRQRKLES